MRVAATRALGVYDDPQAVELAVNALLDPDRDTAVAPASRLSVWPAVPRRSGRQAGNCPFRAGMAGRTGAGHGLGRSGLNGRMGFFWLSFAIFLYFVFYALTTFGLICWSLYETVLTGVERGQPVHPA